MNHKCDPRNHLRNVQLLERLLAPTQVGGTDVVASMERLEQELRVVRQRFGEDEQNSGDRYTWCAFRKSICPKILRHHLAVQASSIDSLEKQRLTIEKFLGCWCPCQDQGRQERRQRKRQRKQAREVRWQVLLVWPCDGGLSEEGCWEAKCTPPQSPRASDPKPKGRGNDGKGKKGASSLHEWPDGHDDQSSGERTDEEVAGLFIGAVSRHERYNRRDWQAWEKFQNGDVESLKFSVMDKLHKPLVVACMVVAAGNRIVLQPENQGGSFIEDVRSKHRKRIFERSGENVLPCWVVKQTSQKRLALLVLSRLRKPICNCRNEHGRERREKCSCECRRVWLDEC